MTLRDRILKALKQKPQTANSLSRTLGNDKAVIKNKLFILRRQGFVDYKLEMRGKVPYRIWRRVDKALKTLRTTAAEDFKKNLQESEHT